MDVDFAIWYPIDAAESIGEVPGGSVEIDIRAVVIGEVVGYRGDVEFRLEEIDLVEEENNRFPLEPFSVD